MSARLFPAVLVATAALPLLRPAFADAEGVGARVVPLRGLEAAALIVRDAKGIAHVQAVREHDLLFLNGWVHAQDRLFQMDVSRRRASGTLAELVGPPALASDVEMRTIGLRRAAERSLGALSPRAVAALEAYAAGVNAYVEVHELPVEYQLLERTRFDPWTPLDSVAVSKLVAFGLSFNLDIQNTQALVAYRTAGEALGFDGDVLFFEDVFRVAPFSPASTVPDATSPRAGPVGAGTSTQAHPSRRGDQPRASVAALELGQRYLGRIEQVPPLQEALDRAQNGGSNEWAIAGALSDSGLPLLANDPHLPLDIPSTFYPIHLTLRSGPLDVVGQGFPGTPLVVVGQNAHVAWGAAMNPMDVTDTFQEQVVPLASSPSGLATIHQGIPEPIIPIPVTFLVNQVGNGVADDLVVATSPDVPPAVLIVPRRNDGPIIALDEGSGAALSVQYTGFGPTREVDAFLAFNLARDLGDFTAGLQWFDVGSQSFVYADAAGNTAYFASAEMPIREDLQAGSVHGLPPYFIRDGTGGNEWLPVQEPQPGQAIRYEILPQDELPHVVNPRAGFFVNANNDPAGTTLDNDPLNQLRAGGGIYYLARAYPSLRAGRITELIRRRIRAGLELSFEAMQAMQADVVLPDAEVFVPYIVNAYAHATRPGADPTLAALAADARVGEAVGRLAGWDFTAPTGVPEGYDAEDVPGDLVGGLPAPSEEEIAASVAATLYSVWRSAFIRNTLDATLQSVGLGSFLPGSETTLAALRHHLEQEPFTGVGASSLDFFAVPGIAEAADRRDAVILRSVSGALDGLAGPSFDAAFGGSTDQDDYRWGRLHRIVLDHPLDGDLSVPPAGGLATQLGLPGIATDGGFEVVDASSHPARAFGANEFMFGIGPARRTVAEASRRGFRAVTSVPGGVSGDPSSPHYADLLPGWLTNEAFPLSLSRAELARNTTSIQAFVPVR